MSRTDVLVDADWLQQHLGDPTVALVEVDEDVSAYAAGHIRGALQMDWTTQLQAAQERDVLGKEDCNWSAPRLRMSAGIRPGMVEAMVGVSR